MICNECNKIYSEKSIRRRLEGGGPLVFEIEGTNYIRHPCCPIKECQKKWTNFEIYVNSD
jgi:hypothetical protein